MPRIDALFVLGIFSCALCTDMVIAAQVERCSHRNVQKPVYWHSSYPITSISFLCFCGLNKLEVYDWKRPTLPRARYKLTYWDINCKQYKHSIMTLTNKSHQLSRDAPMCQLLTLQRSQKKASDYNKQTPKSGSQISFTSCLK